MRDIRMNVSRPMLFVAALAGSLLSFQAVSIAGESVALKNAHISLDKKTLKKGLEVFTDVCMGCHSARYLTYRDLMDYPELAVSRSDVDDLREDKPLTASLTSALTPADALQNYGIVPPDLSVMAKAREDGGNYIYSLLTGFEHDPKGRIPDGNYNVYFPGHRIAMMDPLSWLDHDKSDEADIKDQARSVASFLVFISDPHQLERKAIGGWVMGFLVLLTFVLWLLKRAVWRDVEH